MYLKLKYYCKLQIANAIVNSYMLNINANIFNTTLLKPKTESDKTYSKQSF